MSQSARVASVEALKHLKEALCTFGVDTQDALIATDLEIRRTLDWVQNQIKHWQRRVRELEEDVNRAKNELVQRKYWSAEKKGPGTTEQEIALKKAQVRLQEAQGKVESCRQWGRLLPQAVTEYQGPAGQLAGMVDANLRHSIAILERRIAALDAYVSMAPPSASGAASTAGTPVAPPAETAAPAATGEAPKE